MRRCLAAVAIVGLLVAGCGGDDPTDAFSTEVVVDGLDRPTQLAIADDAWFLAQLNGGEDDATGQVLRLDPAALDVAPVVVVDDLAKPTGVAVFADELWIMEERRLTRGPLDGTDREVVLDELAFNGRSEGTLTVDGDRLLFDTSGSTRIGTGPGGSPTEISGALWAVSADGTIEQVAWGFKHAYAHVRSDDGVLWTTEMSDGSYDGVPARDEIVAVAEGANHGWPSCVDDNRPVVESGVDAPCDGVPASLVTFEPGATPTGIAIAPWDPEVLVVALWVEQRLVTLPASGDEPPSLLTDVLERPQHIVADGDRLLVTDHEAGTIVAVSRN
ncbi:MAG: PQQ-dependent sugar dehydrogenase [Actinomycetota bacterium]